MINKCLKLIIFLFFLCVSQVYANTSVNYEDLKLPKPLFHRIGTTNLPEIQCSKEQVKADKEEVKVNKVKNETFSQNINSIESRNLTYADLSIKKISTELLKDMDNDYSYMQSDLSLLWQGAAMKSETVKFAIYKLSNPEKDKPNEGMVKKLLTTVAGMSTLVGAGTGNPLLSSAALIGGNTLGILSEDTKALNYKYSKVNDVDMMILVRKIDELQQKVVDLYYDYLSARKRYDKISEFAEKYKKNYDATQGMSRDVIVIADAYYREILDEQTQARGVFFEKRSKLEQLVGADVFKEFEASIEDRYK